VKVIELTAGDVPKAGHSIYQLLRDDAIVVLRAVPEIHELARTVRQVAIQLGGDASQLTYLLQAGEAQSIETLSAFYRAFRHLRDSRYVSCLFSDLISSFDLPAPILVDSAFCRMMVPKLAEKAYGRPDLFNRSEFGPGDPNEAEKMIQGGGWGNAHRDIDVRHYHYQLNLWFPFHDVEETRTLLLFPEAYRRDVAQYDPLGDPDNPDGWGFGPALRVPLRLGDALLFHSQQLHASPSQARDKDRFTVELRIAAACIDDNARIYRRLFWGLDNFLPGAGAVASVRARQLAELEGCLPSLERALQGQTAHAVVHSLFRRPESSLAAGYVHRSDDVLNDVIELGTEAWNTILAKLSPMPSGEDLWLILARVLAHQKQRDALVVALQRVSSTTESYFWALEAGRIAAENRLYKLASAAFDRAATLAAGSEASLDRYTPAMPPPSSPGMLQLRPSLAQRAAIALARAARSEREGSPPTTPTFDYRLFVPIGRLAIASYEHYDLISASGFVIALPIGFPFDPEKLLDGGARLLTGESVADVERKAGNRLGRPLRHPALVTTWPFRPRSYWLASLFGTYFVRPLSAAAKLKRQWWR
jgi:hypothetical protein